MNEKIPAFVLNDFLRFERKVYSLFGVSLGRAIQFKTFLYFAVIGILVLALSYAPGIGSTIRDIPFIVTIALVWLVSYLLTDIGTENRSPLRFFASAVRHTVYMLRRESYYKGKVLKNPQPVRFKNAPAIATTKQTIKREAVYQFKAIHRKRQGGRRA